ncbi:dihydrolipoamide acetyltransferase family protein [Marinococcus luteus]|uniref:dihydrolipoamide acetyltransferase family protein n=1 Tax=Marinococcus luteus TaxID=1122204 RepID=UPI002ACCBB86|nr:dihydrolipoamide acetyltransferase family protein [Marinococcus luteus]MDZ5782805.1 dihydrolipoamide acetyltransferase family protein [Marinococcus luteus]
MATEIIMPKFGMSMNEGTIAEWLKKEGEEIKKGEPIVTISSDKITNEVEAPADGRMLKIAAAEDETLAVGQVIAYMGEPGEQIAESTATEEGAAPEPAEAVAEEPAISREITHAPQAESRVRVSPAAKKLASAHGIPVENIEGTGPKGRITKKDVEALIESDGGKENTAPPQNEPASANPSLDTTQVTAVKGMRKVIADRMQQSLQESAQLTLMRKADITGLLQMQKQANAELEQNGEAKTMTLTAFIAKATVLALQKHPAANASFQDGTLYRYDHVHLGVAAALTEGLVVPVIFHAEAKSVREIGESIRLLGHGARENQLASEDMQGSTFTITNVGATGVEYFTPILNTPEAAILGVGAVQAGVQFHEGIPMERKLLPLSLTFDHRALDGEPAGKFLAELTGILENPHRLFF